MEMLQKAFLRRNQYGLPLIFNGYSSSLRGFTDTSRTFNRTIFKTHRSLVMVSLKIHTSNPNRKNVNLG